jgi:hypothetical protein
LAHRDREYSNPLPAQHGACNVEYEHADQSRTYRKTMTLAGILITLAVMPWVWYGCRFQPEIPPFHSPDLMLFVRNPYRLGYALQVNIVVFYSTDGAATWQNLKSGLTFTNVRGLALSDDGSVLYVGTVGGGVFRLGTPHASQ